MKSSFSKIVVILAVMAALMGALSFFQSRMNGIRAIYHLTDNTPLENAPPMVAFTSIALGGFRGLLADYLWLRTGKMQDEGKYYEMVQLADWIVKLQPRFTGAHAFLGWNMSYNVSVTFTNFEDRWRWVKRGIELIRDEALEYNPGDPELFRQLGWIYQHKMGAEMDDANLYYKVQMAEEMIRLFGDYYEQWEVLDKAPLNETKLMAVLDRKAEAFKALLSSFGLDFRQLETLFREKAAIPEEHNGQPFRKRFDELGVTEPVELCLRHRWMVYKYRLDPQMMMKCNRKFGRLDWRLPEAHAIYWAERGREKWFSESARFKRLSCDRMIFQSLNAAFRTGKLLYLKGDLRTLQMTPNFAVADAADAEYRMVAEKYPDLNNLGPYVNFIVDGVVRLYSFGYKKKAAQWFQHGRELNPDRFKGELEEFAIKEMTEDMDSASRHQAQAIIQSYLFQAYNFLAYAENDESDEYKTFEGLTLTAKGLYDHYAKFISGTELRRGLPPFDEMRKVALGTVQQALDNGGQTTRMLAANLRNYHRDLPIERFIPRAEEIAAPKVK